VFYAYGKAGIRVPRTTRAQFRHSRQVSLSELHPGDLLFFRLGREQISHVGIYAGNGHFIHAPSQGKQVSYTSMANSYWKTRLLAARRYH
jgi:cell wall-associated NlpC family hydrolase